MTDHATAEPRAAAPNPVNELVLPDRLERVTGDAIHVAGFEPPTVVRTHTLRNTPCRTRGAVCAHLAT
jgi:hypothetical protein